MTPLEAALDYLKRGWPVLPCKLWFEKPGDLKAKKKPLIDWKEFQTRLPTEAEVRSWWKKWPWAQVGMAVGPDAGPFGIVTVDYDLGHSREDLAALALPLSISVQTPTGGGHTHLKYPKGKKIKNSVGKIKPFIDIRGQGGFVVLPPSVYPDGRPYTWLIHPDNADLAECPEAFLELAAEPAEYVIKNWSREIKNGVPDGQRNQTATSLIGQLLRHQPTYLWNSTIWPLIRAWNERNQPPWPEHKLMMTFNSIANSEYKRRRDYAMQKMRESGDQKEGEVLDQRDAGWTLVD